MSEGKCTSEMTLRNPSKRAHFRGLTTANRILQLYVATDNPSTMKLIVVYTMKVYLPMWFTVKTQLFLGKKGL